MNELTEFIKSKIDSVQKLTKVNLNEIKETEINEDLNRIILFDKSNQKIECNYQLIGMYNYKYNIWNWACSVEQFINKKNISISSDLKNKFNNYRINNIELSDFLFFSIHNNSIHIMPKKLNLLLKLLIQIIDCVWIYPIKSNYDPNIDIYLVLNNIVKY